MHDIHNRQTRLAAYLCILYIYRATIVYLLSFWQLEKTWFTTHASHAVFETDTLRNTKP